MRGRACALVFGVAYLALLLFFGGKPQNNDDDIENTLGYNQKGKTLLWRKTKFTLAEEEKMTDFNNNRT